jgi:membrane protein YqaA with SNARE-associated domain
LVLLLFFIKLDLPDRRLLYLADAIRHTTGACTCKMIYFSLFLASFVAATILPMQSEAVLAGLLLLGKYPAWVLLTVASTGNILGSVANWLIGRGIDRYKSKRWFPASERQLERASKWYGRYGRWSLLLSWAPIIGDPLTIVAGILRERFLIFLLLVSIAKVGRYLAIAAVILKWSM